MENSDLCYKGINKLVLENQKKKHFAGGRQLVEDQFLDVDSV